MRFYLLFFVFCFCICTSFAQQLIMAKDPGSAGFSSERLDRIDKAMNDWVKQGYTNGCVGMIVYKGKIVYHKAAGYNDIENKTPLSKDAIFRIASQTKAITSVAAMILFEEGKFLLDDAVGKYIPSFQNQVVIDKFNPADSTYTTVPAKRNVTIRDLLTHTSGIGYASIGTKEATAIYAKNKITVGLNVNGESLLQAMTRLGTLPLMFQPGEKWMYGLNTDLLGALVEVWSGMSLEAFFTSRIFQPLGMNDTYFNIPPEKASRLVNLYSVDSLGHLVHKPDSTLVSDLNYPLRKNTYFSGGASLSSTLKDYAIFLQMLLNGGAYNGQRILSANSVRLMTSNQIGKIDFGTEKFGLGFALVTDQSAGEYPTNVGTFAWGGAFATSYWADPKENMIILFYKQILPDPHGELSKKFLVMAYAALNE